MLNIQHLRTHIILKSDWLFARQYFTCSDWSAFPYQFSLKTLCSMWLSYNKAFINQLLFIQTSALHTVLTLFGPYVRAAKLIFYSEFSYLP